MNNINPLSLYASFFVAFLLPHVCAGQIRTASYTVTDLGDLGGSTSGASGINDNGQIAGQSYFGPNAFDFHAFLYSNGIMSDLGAIVVGTNNCSYGGGINNLGQVVGSSSGNACLFDHGTIINLRRLPGFNASVAYDINDHGDIVGTSDSQFAYLYRNGAMTILGTLPGFTFRSEANAVNNSGQVVGTSYSLYNIWHAFLYDHGQMMDLGNLPGMSFSSAWDINSLGQVVGESGSVNAAVYSHAFLYSNGQMMDLGTLPGYPYESLGRGVNDLAQVVGYSMRSSDYLAHGFIYTNGRMTDLNTLIDPWAGWVIEYPAAINNSGCIVGTGTNPLGRRHAFVLRPVPVGVVVPPQTQTVEAGSVACLSVRANGYQPLFYQWLFNGTDGITDATNSTLYFSAVQPEQSGLYSVIITNCYGAATSVPAMLSVVAPVPRRTVPALSLMGQTASLISLDSRTTLRPFAGWETFDTVALTNAVQWYFDLTAPLAPQRFYRAWQTNVLSPPSVREIHLVPAIILTGAIGSLLRVDYINQFGPIDAWVTNLATVTLTNTSQLYFDTSSIGQPQRLWRVVPVP